MNKKTKKLRQELLEKPKRRKWSPEDLLSTGSTVLNCAISDSEKGGILPGEIVITVGASESGKTAWYNALLAEAAMDNRFDDYDFYVDDSEGGNLFDIKKYWGKRLWKRVKAPNYIEGKEIFSRTLEELEDTLKDICERGKPFIFVEDSMDALIANQERKEYKAQRLARQKGLKEPGTYGQSRPKKIRAILRHIRPVARELKAIIVLVFQETTNLGFTGPVESKTFAGGTAPRFFANLQLWFNTIKSIVKETGGVKKEIGTKTRIKIKKNRLTGKKCIVDLEFYNGYGFDDLGSCVDFLCATGHWSGNTKSIRAVDFGEKLGRSALIRFIEENGFEDVLRTIVGIVWREQEEKNMIRRKPRYL